MNRWFVLVFAATSLGWVLVPTVPGVLLVVAASVFAIVLLARYRSPEALTHFAFATGLGWWLVLIRYPAGFVVPVALLVVARVWRQRVQRREAIAAADPSNAL